ncbi:hypothetical protein M378DRAFT_168767 [Amanita muscaria Koide BX008]|uniref:Uncharacterized protein n=1 Tax=Amanita muscaria (strain Koide BX008) TaxID=946122 RepID=A0A0C2SAN9_AMAMK|nr:hypothetical protein M378DRAFT_168767 [Amanita muscaria Koide BX008]
MKPFQRLDSRSERGHMEPSCSASRIVQHGPYPRTPLVHLNCTALSCFAPFDKIADLILHEGIAAKRDGFDQKRRELTAIESSDGYL